MRWLPLVVFVAACRTASPGASEPQPAASQAEPAAASPAAAAAAPAAPAPADTPIADTYREAAARILAAAEADAGAWDKLSHLTDRIGHRLSGSRGLEQAVDWAIQAMKADGHEEVRGEKVMVPHWVRGEESASLVAPVERPLSILGLGNAVGTPRGGLVGEVVVVRSFEELDQLGAQVKGKIVLFNHPMPAFKDGETGYGEAVMYRGRGPAAAAKLGARAALVRSATARSLRTPHTGATRFEEGQKPIPAAALSLEDTELITRLAAAGPVRVKLTMGARFLPDAPSANVIGELRGREKPDEIVVIGGHLDSWDVGQGAHDDGAGCVIAMQALTVLRKLDLRPRRTIRVVLFTNEENGVRGAKQYALDHAAELPRHVLAIEADTGAFRPMGFEVQGIDAAVAQVTDVVSLLQPIDANRAVAGHAGTDVEPMAAAGVPLLGLWMDRSTYFDYHHSHADTIDKVDPVALAHDVAAMAIMAYVAADVPVAIPRGQPAAEPPR